MNRVINNERRRVNHQTSSALGAAFVIMLMVVSIPTQAGKIISIPSESGAPGFGGWDLANVDVILNGTQSEVNGTGSWFNEENGAYQFAGDSDFSYVGHVDDGAGTLMGYALAKTWPVGEPSGIKIINDDAAVKEPKPPNCIMATSYLDDYFLDSEDPRQVTCSGPFQSHKRYKIAMLPSTVDGEGSESVDLVFNVEPEDGSRDYQVFQKINNWTDGRLAGFTVQVGFGVGESFQTATSAGVDLNDLNISVPSDIWDEKQLAIFSAGLFGPQDKHTGKIGFFDPNKRAGFLIDEYTDQMLTDSLHATRTLGSNYAEVPIGAAADNQFGPWLPDNMLPYGIFFDDDGNPETDAKLLAWYGFNPNLPVPGLGWMGGSQDSDGPFSAIPTTEIEAMGANLSFTMGQIDDLVNVGLNYLVTVGNVSTFPAGNTFTIRITPTPDTSGTEAPSYVGIEPDPLLLFSSSVAEILLEPKDTFVIGSLLTARVGDADLNLDPLVADEVDVVISTTDPLVSSQTLTLIEQGVNRGVFAAALPEGFSQVAVGTVVTMAYVDESESETKESSTTAGELVSGGIEFQQSVDINHQWSIVKAFDSGNSSQLLFGFSPATFNGVQPGVVRIEKNVDDTSSESFSLLMRFQEFTYLDQFHLTEQVGLMGFYPGVAILDDETVIATGSFPITGTGDWKSVNVAHTFPGTPHVFLFAQTSNGGQPPILRVRNVTTNSFEAALYEEEQLINSGHVEEIIGYFVIYNPTEQGSLNINGEIIDFALETLPVSDTWTSVFGRLIKLQEEQSKDLDLFHVYELMDVMKLGEQIYAQSVTHNGNDPFTIRIR